MQDDIQKLLQKQMDRREFLKHVMVGFVALTGIGALIKALNKVDQSDQGGASYGGSSYGGKKS